MMQLLALIIKLLAALLRLLPLRERVALLSRQSSHMSLDYQLLAEELERRYLGVPVVICLCEPEDEDRLGFALGTVHQLYYSCTSRVVVCDGYLPAVSIPAKDPRVTVIEMWHAVGAIKKFGYQCLDTPAGRTAREARIGRMHRNYDYVIAGGPGAVDAYAEAFDIEREKILPLGLPRMDYVRDTSPDGLRAQRTAQVAKRFPFLTEGRRVVLYAPTLRRGADANPAWLTTSIRAVAGEVLAADPEALVVAAPHPLDGEFDPALLDEFAGLRAARGVESIDLLPFASEVVTDYSTMAFEAALAGVPVRFYVSDIARYRSSPGLNLPVEQLTQEDLLAYFDGVGPGATARIAELVVESLEG